MFALHVRAIGLVHARVMYTFCGRDKIERKLAQSRVAITTRGSVANRRTDPSPPLPTAFTYVLLRVQLTRGVPRCGDRFWNDSRYKL